MNRRLSILSVLLALSLPVAAQFSGPAFDPNVYIPKKGVDVDVVYSKYWDSIGFNLHNLGPSPVSVNDRISFLGYVANPYYQTVFDATPPFLFTNLKVTQETNVIFPNGTIFGHFHSTKVKDAFVESDYNGKPVIFWADDQGNYDSSRRTVLWSSVQGDNDPLNGWGFKFSRNCVYVTYLSSDTLEDIIIGGRTDWTESDKEKTYLLHYRGGSRLYNSGSPIYQDTSIYFGNFRYGTTADFRGTGKKDFLGIDNDGNWFFYKNESTFNLEKFARSMLEDTLLAAWQNPNLKEFNYPYKYNRFTMRALPRPDWDKSVDFMPRLNTDDWRQKCISIFRGGPHFGQNRLTLDSIEYIIKSPGLLDASWDGILGINAYLDAGDMTGTGNPVLMVGAGFSGYQTYNFFYVLGKAIDDKIDMVISHPYTSLANAQVSLNADVDAYRDVLMGAYVRANDQAPYPGRAELWLVHGTNRIPATVNPGNVDSFLSIDKQVRVFPNPAKDRITLAFKAQRGGASIKIQDVLGRVVFSKEVIVDSGVQSIELLLPYLNMGTYVLTLQLVDGALSGKFSVM